MRYKRSFLLFVLMFLLVSIACNSLFPRTVAPGSIEEQVAEGGMQFKGSGNVTYIGCQDPTAEVLVSIGVSTKELDGVAFNTPVNLVNVYTNTDGTQVKAETCEKRGQGETYSWPADGIYYPDEAKIVFTTCTQNQFKAEGVAYLVGDGFEGTYTCYDHDGGLMYEVAISAYEIVP